MLCALRYVGDALAVECVCGNCTRPVVETLPGVCVPSMLRPLASAFIGQTYTVPGTYLCVACAPTAHKAIDSKRRGIAARKKRYGK